MSTENIILVIGGERSEREPIVRMLVAEQYRVYGAEKPGDAMAHSDKRVDLVISDLKSRLFNGLELMRAWKARQPDTPFIFVTDGSDVPLVVDAMKLGAVDCIVKPVDTEDLRVLIANAIENGAEKTSPDEADRTSPANHIDIPPGTSLEDLERAAVEQALAEHHGNRTHAAKTLGISVRTLQRKLKAWGMPMSSSPSSRGTALVFSAHSPSSNFSATNAHYSH